MPCGIWGLGRRDSLWGKTKEWILPDFFGGCVWTAPKKEIRGAGERYGTMQQVR